MDTQERTDTDTTTKAYPASLVGEHCVVRTHSAGVHLGEVIAQDGKQVTLKDARRLWRWFGAFTLNEVALTGISNKGSNKSRIAEPVPIIVLTEATELIPTSIAARATFDACHE
ncbi:MAG: hypothetical protein Q8L23_15745 [Caulobacter sp.]|nr:hypothetical protein [Caulobacter sp.]